MLNIPIAVQLYSVRDDSAKDFPATIEAVAKLGYQAVEFAGFHGLDANQLKTLLDDNGLQCAGTHAPLATVQGDELQKTAEFMAILGSNYLVVPYTGPDQFGGGRDGALKLAEVLTQAHEEAKKFGARVGYHNHGWEFETIADGGETTMQILAKNTPDDFILQVDTGNAQEGDADVISYLKEWQPRVTTVHLKPFLKNADADFDRYYIGEDDSDWKAILGAISPDSTQFIIVEQERYPQPNSPLQCVERCLKNLKGLL